MDLDALNPKKHIAFYGGRKILAESSRRAIISERESSARDEQDVIFLLSLGEVKDSLSLRRVTESKETRKERRR